MESTMDTAGSDMNQLIMSYGPMIRKLVNRYSDRRYYNEAYSDAMEGAWKALVNYDANKGPIGKHVYMGIIYSIRNGNRRRFGGDNDVIGKLGVPITDVNKNVLQLSSGDTGLSGVDWQDYYSCLTSDLDNRKQIICYDYLIKEKSLTDIARDIGIDKSVVCRHLKRAMSSIKDKLDLYSRDVC